MLFKNYKNKIFKIYKMNIQNFPIENQSNKEIFKILFIASFGIFVANTWNNFIVNTIDAIYPLNMPNNKWKRIIVLLYYSIIMTIVFIITLKILNRIL